MGIRLLIVDNQPLIRSGVAEVLRRAPDIQVVGQAATAREAVDLVCAERPDVVVIEPQMPDGDGLQTIRTIRAECPDARILVLTQGEDPDEAVRALEAGAVGYVLKDIEPEQLLGAVRWVAGGQAMLSPKITRYLLARLASGNGSAPAALPAHSLTAREIEIVRLVALGLSDREIASRLFLSEATVKTHLKVTYRKLRVRNRAQAAAFAALAGLLPASALASDFPGRRRRPHNPPAGPARRRPSSA